MAKKYKSPLLKANQAFDVLQGGMSKQPNQSSPANMSVAPSISGTATAAPRASVASPSVPAPSVPTPAAPAGNGRSFSAATAAEFESLYGRNPKGKELMDFVAGTYEPSAIPRTPAFPSGNINNSVVQDPGADKAGLESELANSRMRTDQIVNGTPAGFTSGTFGQSDVGQQILDTLRNLGMSGGQLDEAQIAAAGEAAAARFDPLILQAQQSAEQGRGKNLARAAATGQLDATAVAGIAALTGNENVGLEDGKAFEGSGGILSRLGAEYDLQISQLKAAQISARRAAEEAERSFQQTGMREDFDRAMQLYDTASKAFSEQNTLAEQKQIAMQRATQIALSQQELSFGAEDRILGQIAPGLVDVDADGNVVRADDGTIAEVAAQYGISPDALGAAVNARIDELNGIQAEQRQAALDALKTQAEIGATTALEQQRMASAEETMAMLPLNQQLKQAQIASQQASAARSRQLINKATQDSSSLTSSDIASAILSGVDLGNFKGVDDSVMNEGILTAVASAPKTYSDYIDSQFGQSIPFNIEDGGIDPTTLNPIKRAVLVDPSTGEDVINDETGESVYISDIVPYEDWIDFDSRVRGSLGISKK